MLYNKRYRSRSNSNCRIKKIISIIISIISSIPKKGQVPSGSGGSGGGGSLAFAQAGQVLLKQGTAYWLTVAILGVITVIAGFIIVGFFGS